MLKFFKGALLFVVAIFLLSACSANVKEEQKATNKNVETAFKGKPEKAETKTKNIQFYLPSDIDVKEEKQNNILLENGSKTYILFYNQQEGPESEVVYNATINANKYDYKETFKKDGKFGFLLIRDVDNNKQEVTVGIGGVKMTTETKTKSMKDDAEKMMQIVNSVIQVSEEKKK